MNSINITNYVNYKSRFNGASSRNNLPRKKDGAYVINLDDKNSKAAHCNLLFIDRNTAVNFDSFGSEYIPPKAVNKTRDKSITQNIFR